jgi:hypothetical protein
MRRPALWFLLALLVVSVTIITVVLVRPDTPAPAVADTRSAVVAASPPDDKCLTEDSFYALTVGEKKACINAFDDSRCTRDRDSLRPIEARWCYMGQGRGANKMKERCEAVQAKVDARRNPKAGRGEDPQPPDLRAEVDGLQDEAKLLGLSGSGCTIRGTGKSY